MGEAAREARARLRLGKGYSARCRSQAPDGGLNQGPVLAHPVGEDDPQDAEDDGIETDQPEDGKGARTRTEGDQDAERNREQAGEPECPATPDLSGVFDARDELEDAGDDRPGGDHEDERERRDAGTEKREHTDRDAGEATEHQRHPVAGTLGGKVKTGNQGEDSGDQRERAEECDQGDERDARPNEGDDPKDDPSNAAERDEPRASGYCLIHTGPPSRSL